MSEEDVELRLKANIERLKQGLTASGENTKVMVQGLKSFEDKVIKLVNVVKPIHDLTERLSLAQRNINKSLNHFEKIHEHFRTVEEQSILLNQRSLLSSPHKNVRDRYYDSITKVCESYAFLDQRRDFVSAGEVLENLEKLRRFAMSALCSQYEKLLVKHAGTQHDYNAFLLREQVVDDSTDDIMKKHENFPQDVSNQLKELSVCIEECGMQDLLVQHYAQARGNLIITVLNELLQSLWRDEFTDSNTLEGDMPDKLLARTHSLSNVKKSWKQRLSVKGHHKDKKSVDGSSVTSDSHSQSGMISVGSGTFSGTRSGKRNQKRYTREDNGMLVLLDLAVYVFKAEMILSTKVLPTGRAGRKIFLDAMLTSCERLADIGMNTGIDETRNSCSESEILLAMADVVGKIDDLEPKFEKILGPDSSYYKQFCSMPTSPRGKGPPHDFNQSSMSVIPDQPWNLVQTMIVTWRRETIQAIEDAVSVLVRPIDSIPATASVHPASTRLVNFVTRVISGQKVVSSLLAFKTKMSPFEAFAKYIEEVLQKFYAMILDIEHRRELYNDGATMRLFILNNIHYVTKSLNENDQLREQLNGLKLVEQRKEDVDMCKTKYMKMLLTPFLRMIDPTQPVGVNFNTRITSNGKKAIKEHCTMLKTWIENTHGIQMKLEVPDFELRTELRYRIRQNTLAKYAQMYTKLEESGFTSKKKEKHDKYLPYDEKLLSTMISQFYEISETTSNAQALVT
eukprot:CAMPEP_0203745404 /NCGR_PEP_ID=MMETSP0098-20131031/1154_1 /ASSEMBLY_ACC=CAM_ASM_000208 /TAXON_ID=96639 /ORGANISM=" , Strain NY0313808BC1" /LENGTH=736 /DNA_ID=CAMNT_0050633173 /DNA_START=118 /DNA_END=2328 /DNA_ORIENTATION=+